MQEVGKPHSLPWHRSVLSGIAVLLLCCAIGWLWLAMGGKGVLYSFNTQSLGAFTPEAYETAGYVGLDVYEVHAELTANMNDKKAFLVSAPAAGHYMVVQLDEKNTKESSLLRAAVGQGPASSPVLQLRGTMQPVRSGKITSSYYNASKELAIPAGEEAVFMNVQLNAGYYHGSGQGLVWAMFVLAVLFMIAGAVVLVLALKGRFQRELYYYIPKDKADAWFRSAANPRGGLWIGEDFLVLQSGLATRCVPLKPVVWVYPSVTRQGLIPMARTLELKMDNGRGISVVQTKRGAASAFRALQQHHPAATYGYETEWQYLYKKSPEALRKPVRKA